MVLSAAHCFIPFINNSFTIKQVFATAGDHNIQEPEKTEQTSLAAQVILHAGYDTM